VQSEKLKSGYETSDQKDIGKNVNPAKWIGGSIVSLYGPKTKQKILGIYHHPKERNKNRDEFLLTIKSARNSPYYTAVAEHIDIVRDFEIRKFGPLALARRNIFSKNRRNKLFKMLICGLETFPMTFTQDLQSMNYLESVSGLNIGSMNIESYPGVKAA